LGTHEKSFNKENLKTKKFLAARVEKKHTFLSISPQPQIRIKCSKAKKII
jgi:hypothetical protein